MHSVNSGLYFAFRFFSVEINLSKMFKRIQFHIDLMNIAEVRNRTQNDRKLFFKKFAGYKVTN